MAETVTGALAAQRAFVADASHQLRNPLTALRLRLSNLQGHVDSAAVDDHGAALEEAERLSELLAGLLALARTERTAPLVEVDVDAAVGDRVEAWRPLAEHTGLRLELDGQPGLTVSAPVGAVETVLDAVLDNAVKFSSAGDAITVHTARHDGRVEISVRDTGPGLGPEELERATDRFWRSPSQSNVEGSGLGLAIAARTVELSGGSLRLESPEGGGLRVVARLPASAGQDAAPAATGPLTDRPGTTRCGQRPARRREGLQACTGTAARRSAASAAVTAAPVAATRSASAASVVPSGASSGCARSACQVSSTTSPVQAAAAIRTSRTRVPSANLPVATSAAASSGSPCRACMPTKCAIRRSPPVVLQPTSGSPGPPAAAPPAVACGSHGQPRSLQRDDEAQADPGRGRPVAARLAKKTQRDGEGGQPEHAIVVLHRAAHPFNEHGAAFFEAAINRMSADVDAIQAGTGGRSGC